MNLDLYEDSPIKSEGGFRDVANDKEMQAYASVLYLLYGLTNVSDSGRVEFVQKYIRKLFPAFDKCKGGYSQFLYLCNPEDRESLKEFVDMHTHLYNSTNLGEHDRINILKKMLDRVKPRYEEDLLIESIDYSEDYKKSREKKDPLSALFNKPSITREYITPVSAYVPTSIVVDANNNTMSLTDITTKMSDLVDITDDNITNQEDNGRISHGYTTDYKVRAGGG